MKRLFVCLLFVLIAVSGFAVVTTETDKGDLIKVGRVDQSSSTCVIASGSTTAYSTQNADVPIVYNTVEVDTLSEFTASTGTFTPKNAGVYSFSLMIQWTSLGGASTKSIGFRKSGSATRWMASQVNVVDVGCVQNCAFTLYLAAGETVIMRMISSGGTDHGQYNNKNCYIARY